MILYSNGVCYMILRSVSRRLNLSSCQRECIRMTTRLYSRRSVKEDHRIKKGFERKLRCVYEQFADVPDTAVFQGLHHVYTVEDHGVYRAKHGEDAHEVEPLLSADWAGDADRTIQRVRLSPSESMLAATLKSNHSEASRCLIVRLEPCAIPQEPMLILDNVFSFEWATDDVLYYTTQEGLRCRHVCRLHLTNTGAYSMQVYEEKDPEFFVEVIRTKDQRLLTINCSSKSSSEVWMIDSRSPLSPPNLVQRRQPGLLYHVEHYDNQLYILANTGPSHEYELLRTPLSSPAMCYWEPVCSPGPGAVIKDMEMLPDHCVFIVRGPQGRLQLQTLPLKTLNEMCIHHLPSWACAIETEHSGTLKRNVFRFLLSSPVHPPRRFLLSPTDERPLSCERVLQHTALSECHTTRLQAISQDGTAVPLTLFHTKSLADLSDVPLLVHVYGAYGVDLSMAFSPEKRLLLEDNWALAYCHVRGGGECGLAWHRAGCLQHKQKGVEDLTACIQTLFQSGVSQPVLTALTAHSAGAVLAGALCNQHPHLLRAVLMQAPFLDVLSTMQDSSLPLTVEERGEWGDPLAYTQDWNNIASYCPYHNITPQLYPSMLITAYSEDSRVPLAGVLKYVKKLQKAIQTHTRNLRTKGHVPDVILNLQPGGDHFGPEDYDQSICEIARQLAFLYAMLGLRLHGSRPNKRGSYS
ncbi:prolyl endopeptidase-like isoform X2 [Tachysurus fulvidraco]|uniref:prolyl endopeptidase-like isoform X2 n=1 Tax=Tachysurus fulvidraco TaxID=1234273 RepID=UPI000F4F4F55|nr:prolyl endopeptidase-like isoform X2 [Tachysurus fulvidraco]